jgi:chemotaxis regulatin CheY-phosphate phosphatase CheZ
MNEMRSGVNRDNMEAFTAREESKKVKGKLSELQPLINQLQAEVNLYKRRYLNCMRWKISTKAIRHLAILKNKYLINILNMVTKWYMFKTLLTYY